MILRGAPLGGESERGFFAFFTLVSRKHTVVLANRGWGTGQRIKYRVQNLLTQK